MSRWGEGMKTRVKKSRWGEGMTGLGEVRVRSLGEMRVWYLGEPRLPRPRVQKNYIVWSKRLKILFWCIFKGNKTITHCLKITQNVAFEFWHFPPIFVLLKLTCLVTLFDRKLRVFKNSPKWNIFGIFSTQNINVARFARNVELDFFCDFQTLCVCVILFTLVQLWWFCIWRSFKFLFL